MHYITYREAAEILGMALTTIQHAVGRSLTKAPSTTQASMLIREQVELFKGKRQISLRLLSPDEYRTWEYYKNAVHSQAADASPVPFVQLPDAYRKLQEPEYIQAADDLVKMLEPWTRRRREVSPQGHPLPV